jgi:hypothetical protein
MPRLRHKAISKKPKQPRDSVPVPGHQDYGGGEDRDKWYRCPNCGFLYALNERGVGVQDKDRHLEPGTYTRTDQDGEEAFHCEGAYGSTQAMCEANGGTWTSRGYKPGDRVGGCPLCGF